MHPKEGWQADGRPPIPGVSRRAFLQRGAGAGIALGSGGLGALLTACGSSSQTAAPAVNALKALPRPNNPVTWPLYKGNKPIKSGLLPEKNATLKIYNWDSYVNPQCLKDFGKKYGCKVEVTTFNTMTEALAKLGSGQTNFDVFMGVTADVIGKIIGTQLIQPLNHSYIPNITQAWPRFTNPFYDQHWQYTVPYTIYTTGIAWRKDHIAEEPGAGAWANGYQFPWQSKYAGKVAILEDYRESISLGLMKNGLYDLNTTDPAQITKSQQSLQQLAKMTNVHIDNRDWSEIPSGQMWIHHAWSGDIASAASYMPKGVPVDVVGYWFPKDGRGPVANDTNTILKTTQNPVLAHLFLNYMLDLKNVLTNISFNGYMQPIHGVTPEVLVHEGVLPKSLMSTVVLESQVEHGLWELQLPVTAGLAWQQAWQAVSHGA